MFAVDVQWLDGKLASYATTKWEVDDKKLLWLTGSAAAYCIPLANVRVWKVTK